MLEGLQKRKTRHALHFLFCFLCPPWVFAWVYFAVSNRNHNQRAELALINLIQNRALHDKV